MITVLPKDHDLEELLFNIGMYWRIIYGSFRIFLSYILFQLVGTPAIDVFYRAMHREMTDDPHDPLIQFIANLLTHHSFSITYFLAGYMLFWGVIDVVLSISMLRHKLWAFPISLVLITAFIIYEMFRYTHTHSPILLSIIVIDIILIFLIRNEQKKLVLRKKRRAELPQTTQDAEGS